MAFTAGLGSKQQEITIGEYDQQTGMYDLQVENTRQKGDYQSIPHTTVRVLHADLPGYTERYEPLVKLIAVVTYVYQSRQLIKFSSDEAVAIRYWINWRREILGKSQDTQVLNIKKLILGLVKELEFDPRQLDALPHAFGYKVVVADRRRRLACEADRVKVVPYRREAVVV